MTGECCEVVGTTDLGLNVELRTRRSVKAVHWASSIEVFQRCISGIYSETIRSLYTILFAAILIPSLVVVAPHLQKDLTDKAD